MGWEDDDKLEEAAGLRGGGVHVPKWVWIVGIILAFAIIGAIMGVRGGSKGSSNMRTLDGNDPASGQIINSINGFDSPQGIKAVCNFQHGQSVKVIDESGGKVQVEGSGCRGWVSKSFLK